MDGTSSDSPEPKIHFQESGKYTYKVTLPEVGCPEKDEHGGILTRKELTGELKVRISGLDVTVKEKDNPGMKYAKVGCLSLPIRHRKRILKV